MPKTRLMDGTDGMDLNDYLIPFRKFLRMYVLQLVLLYVFLFLAGVLQAAQPKTVYLTWVDDPATSMVVQWIEPSEMVNSSLRFRCCSKTSWKSQKPVVLPIDRGDMSLKRVFLQRLEPNEEYAFEIIHGTEASKEYRFRTMPNDLAKPLRFVVGGDAYFHYELFQKMNASIASLSPDFVVIGGDIAYALGASPLFKRHDWQWQRWRTFLETWTRQMVDSSGRLIPLLAVVGNHDVKGAYSKLKSGELKPSLFYTLFPLATELGSYRRMVFGDYLALFLLDSGHTHEIDKEQRIWLGKQLEASQPIPYKMAVYHIPAYPSHSRFKGHASTLIRNTWSPLFEEFGVQAAFEHHNHTYKRTPPICAEKLNEKGVIYLGDGSWGVSPRRPRTPSQEWYIAKSASINAVFFVTLEKEACKIVAIDNRGRIFDEVPIIKPSELEIGIIQRLVFSGTEDAP